MMSQFMTREELIETIEDILGKMSKEERQALLEMAESIGEENEEG